MKTTTFPLSFFNKVYRQFASYFEDDNDIHYESGVFVQAVLPPSPQLEEEQLIFSEGDEMRMFVAHFEECTIVGWCKSDLSEKAVADILKGFTQNFRSLRKYEEEKKAVCVWNGELFLGKKNDE